MVVRVDGKGERVYYGIAEHDPDAGEQPGRVFAVVRLGAAYRYVVKVGSFPSCECLGFLMRGQCVHANLLFALIKSNRL
jgi:hypothetical protein